MALLAVKLHVWSFPRKLGQDLVVDLVEAGEALHRSRTITALTLPGTEPVRRFDVTRPIGIVGSFFTALHVSRSLFLVGSRAGTGAGQPARFFR